LLWKSSALRRPASDVRCSISWWWLSSINWTTNSLLVEVSVVVL
jgi:hypothetical protein